MEMKITNEIIYLALNRQLSARFINIIYIYINIHIYPRIHNIIRQRGEGRSFIKEVNK